MTRADSAGTRVASAADDRQAHRSIRLLLDEGSRCRRTSLTGRWLLKWTTRSSAEAAEPPVARASAWRQMQERYRCGTRARLGRLSFVSSGPQPVPAYSAESSSVRPSHRTEHPADPYVSSTYAQH